METITKTFGQITVDSVSENMYKPQVDQAQLRQIVTKTYPSAQISNNMQDSLFGASSFNLEDGASYDQTRVTWISVPKGTTAEQVTAQLKANPNARIYRVLSNEPILTDAQESAIASGLTTLDVIAARQLVVDGNSGDTILHNGKEQYAANFFSLTAKEDIDMRSTVTSSVEAPFELEAEGHRA